MQDLSDRVPGLFPTGQGAGNTTDPDQAMTAPGSEPSAAYQPDHGEPGGDATAYEPGNLVHGDRPVTTLRMGQWNDFGGGPAPGGA
jgi:hypothetical protein